MNKDEIGTEQERLRKLKECLRLDAALKESEIKLMELDLEKARVQEQMKIQKERIEEIKRHNQE